MERYNRSKGPITISLVGLTNEAQTVELTVPAAEISGLVSEFTSPVYVNGTVARLGRKVHVSLVVQTLADFVCDRSLDSYQESIEVTVSLDYILDGDVYAHQLGLDVEPDEIRGLREDAQWIDVTDDVRQELVVALPLKRIAPAYRDKEFEELLGEVTKDEGQPDDRWEVLKKISKTKQ